MCYSTIRLGPQPATRGGMVSSPLDVDLMREAARLMIGELDFMHFDRANVRRSRLCAHFTL